MTANISAHVRWTGLLAATLLVTAGCADTSKDQGADGTASDIDYSTRVMNLEQPRAIRSRAAPCASRSIPRPDRSTRPRSTPPAPRAETSWPPSMTR